MVVITLESTVTATATSVIFPQASVGHPLIKTGVAALPAKAQCVVSQGMLRSQMHRRTNSPDMLLFLKVPEPTAPIMNNNTKAPSAEVSDEDEEQRVPPQGSVPAISRKRQAPEELRDGADGYRATAVSPSLPIIKKARLILLETPPVAVVTVIRRSVHFEPQEKDVAVVKTFVRYYDRVEDWNVANIWWSGAEMLEIQSREKSAIGVMSFCCDHYSMQVLNLLKIARDKTCGIGMATMVSESPVWVANSPARGLERDIVQGFKQRKRQVVRKVLQSQYLLKTARHEVTGEYASADNQSLLLGAQYQKWSHPMTRFAQVLAEGDAQAVVDNNIIAVAF